MSEKLGMNITDYFALNIFNSFMANAQYQVIDKRVIRTCSFYDNNKNLYGE